MTIKEVAQLTGLSHQAIYKRLKSHGLKLETIKDKASGHFTPDGAAAIMELFDIKAPDDAPEVAQKPTGKADATEVEKLRNQVAELTTEVERLRNQVASLEDERNYLRGALEREQQIAGMSIAKLPAPAPALPPTNAGKGRLRTWWDRVKGGRKNGNR